MKTKTLLATSLLTLCVSMSNAFASSGFEAPAIVYPNPATTPPATSPHGFIDSATAKSFSDLDVYRAKLGQYKTVFRGPDSNGNNYTTQIRRTSPGVIAPITQVIRRSPAGISGVTQVIQKVIPTAATTQAQVPLTPVQTVPTQNVQTINAYTQGVPTNYYNYPNAWSTVAQPDDSGSNIQQGSWNTTSMQANNAAAGPPVVVQTYNPIPAQPQRQAYTYQQLILSGLSRLLSH